MKVTEKNGIKKISLTKEEMELCGNAYSLIEEIRDIVDDDNLNSVTIGESLDTGNDFGWEYVEDCAYLLDLLYEDGKMFIPLDEDEEEDDD